MISTFEKKTLFLMFSEAHQKLQIIAVLRTEFKERKSKKMR
jgi:hypothetical protein